jgi:hypothetical protein
LPPRRHSTDHDLGGRMHIDAAPLTPVLQLIATLRI